jgi:CDP-glucose 4,6-dehydratase
VSETTQAIFLVVHGGEQQSVADADDLKWKATAFRPKLISRHLPRERIEQTSGKILQPTGQLTDCLLSRPAVSEVPSVSMSSFWANKRVLITGHTGLKGAWAWAWLEKMGAKVSGFSLAPDTSPNLAELMGLTKSPHSFIGDIRNRDALQAVVGQVEPDFVLHMAAQALVRRSYKDPIATFDTNVRGTLNLLDVLRDRPAVKACLVVTSDKVYENNDLGRRFTEDDQLGGSDPYSASKAACELATSSFARSFFSGPQGSSATIATARSGNVIGGGDWSEDRIVPDIWRARQAGRPVELRYPNATRPWQHVLEPLAGYFMFLQAMADGSAERTLNFGPTDAAEVTVAKLVDMFCNAYGEAEFSGWTQAAGHHPKEAALLAIDASRAVSKLGWHPRLTPAEAIEWTAQWYAAFDRGNDMVGFTHQQIKAYEQRLASAPEAQRKHAP